MRLEFQLFSVFLEVLFFFPSFVFLLWWNWLVLTCHSLTEKARVGIIAAHLSADAKATEKAPEVSVSSSRPRPPITTHALDVARGYPASGLEVHLEMWKDTQKGPSFTGRDSASWALLGSSVTNIDGRSGQLLGITDYITSGFYRISFNTGKYNPSGFFPYVSIIFEVKESQKSEHFHVPLLLSPFSFSTYRGS